MQAPSPATPDPHVRPVDSSAFDATAPRHKAVRGPSGSGAHTFIDWIAGAGVFCAAAVVAWGRQPAVARGTLWAEEGAFFLQDALNHGAWSVIFKPYQGYLQVVPRLLAAVALDMRPFVAMGISLTALSCMVTAIVAVVVFVCSSTVLPSLWLRLVAASITVLAPSMMDEVLGNTPNLHWYFIWMTPWILLYTPRTWRGSGVLSLVALLGALSEIQMALFIPLFAWQWRNRKRWPIYGALMIGVICEIVVTLVWPRTAPPGPSGLRSLLLGYLFNVVLPLAAPTPHAWVFLVATAGIVRSGMVLLLPAVAAVVIVMWKGSAVQRIAMGALALSGPILYTAAIELNRGAHYNAWSTAEFIHFFARPSRYAVVPQMLLIAVVLVAAQVLISRSRAGAWAGGAVAAGLVAVMLLQFFPVTTLRSGGPLWAPAVATAAHTCRTTDEHRVVVPTAPALQVHKGGSHWEWKWAVRVPCSYLRAHHKEA